MPNEKRLELINKWDVVNKLIQLENNYNFYKDVWDAQTLYRRICEHEIVIGKTPTVDAVPVVHGRWIVENEESIRCSECCFNRATIKMPLNYCPMCGAKMGA